MKRLWVDVRPYSKDLVIAALESGAEAVLIPDGDSHKVRQLGRIKTIEKDGDLRPGRDVEFIEIASKEDQHRAAAIPQPKVVVLSMRDWTIIPIENLLASRGSNIMVRVDSVDQARLMIEVLERGADGVLLHTTDIDQIKQTGQVLKDIGQQVPLTEATVTAVRQLGMGDRSCLDTCTQMGLGEGMLVGNTASGFLLVHSESIENPYVATRPFRVNAGAVHAYVLTPGGKTKYLCDMRAGDQVLIVSHTGKGRIGYLGRNKIESRPLILVEAMAEQVPVGLILQNAETICLVAPGGAAVSVTRLAPGQKVLAHIERVARHFGMEVQETLVER
ncbi:MAG: 3-dehydroquinate synthase II [Sedimentisphaerales bacterium]|nr:3-dehydroquinate synthase II [Sedimentisphaerales bacterium]